MLINFDFESLLLYLNENMSPKFAVVVKVGAVSDGNS